MRSPFKFLDPFTLEDRDSFFGREKEVEQLYAMVNQNRLILVYGPSGTGKTSLVQCGLASQFETVDWYPIFIRKGEDINRSLDEALQKALKGELFDTYAETIEELHALYVRPIYLLFDQFEELFILGRPEEQAAFFKTISTLVDARLPCRILFILREEYLAHLYEFERVVPTLLDRRLRVEPMSYKNVGEVIQRSCSRFNISLEDAEANTEQVIQNLSSGSSGIHLPYLQVYLDMLYRQDYARTYRKSEIGSRKSEDPAVPSSDFALPTSDFEFPPLTFTTEEIAELGEIDNVLDKFLEEQSLALQAEMEERHPGFPENGILRILDLFVTEEGTKRPINYTRSEGLILLPDEALERIARIEAPALSESLQKLESLRLLRISDDTIELPHDTLAILIDQKRTDEQRQLNAVLRQLKAAYAAYGRTQEYLTRKQLNAYEDFIPQLSLDDNLLVFISDSKADVEAQERAEKERRERELELTRQKLEAEQRAARRQRIFTGLIGIALVAMVGLAIWAFGQQRQATQNAELAQEKSEEAIHSAKEAEKQRQEALSQKSVADSNALLAEERRQEADSITLVAIGEKDRAERERQRAEETLNRLNTTREQVVDVLIEQARELIFECKYEDALVKLLDGANLVGNYPPLGRALMELAFFYGEAGDVKQATSLAATVARLLDKPAGVIKSLPTEGTFDYLALERYRKVLRPLDPQLYDSLFQRYYPVMINVQGGTFTMGCDTLRDKKCEYDDEKPPHPVTLSPFQLAQTEATVWQYGLYCAATGQDSIQNKKGSTWPLDGNTPVIIVTWYDAARYANWVSRQMGIDTAYTFVQQTDENGWEVNPNSNAKETFRLPTEAEWEYAARGGAQQAPFIYSGSNEIDEVAWWDENRTMPVASKKANGLGIYDMSGNVWEWCQDWYGAYEEEAQINPIGPNSGSGRVLRGGSWSYSPGSARCASRFSFFLPDYRCDFCGFRLARTGGQ